MGLILLSILTDFPDYWYVRQRGWVDSALIPYLDQINSLKQVKTLQCCAGHPEKQYTGYVKLRLPYSWVSPLIVELLKIKEITYIDFDRQQDSLSVHWGNPLYIKYILPPLIAWLKDISV